MFFYRLFVLLLFALKKSSALKCYSCGDENQFLGQEYSAPLPCEELDKSDNMDAFIIECPAEYLGCITQSKGRDEVMRTCDTLAIDDCQTANGITYCYCSTDLCNGKQIRADAHKTSRDVMLNYPSDDEDYSEMSGHGNSDIEDEDDEDDDLNKLEDERNYDNSSSQLYSKGKFFLLVLSLNFFLRKTLIYP